MTDREHVSRWLTDYVAAWKSYGRGDIEALFTEDVAYRFHPYDEPVRGRDAVVAAWLFETDDAAASSRDEPGTYEAEYRPIAVDGEVAVATGTSTYFSKPGGPVRTIYENCFVIRFAPDGRCSEFTEYFIERPPG